MIKNCYLLLKKVALFAIVSKLPLILCVLTTVRCAVCETLRKAEAAVPSLLRNEGLKNYVHRKKIIVLQ